MTEGQVLTNISEAIIEGLKSLSKMKDLLSNEKERHPYPITNIDFRKEEGKINFNFHWVKLFLKFQLHGKDFMQGRGEGERIQFKYPLIWGRYGLQNGIETEEPIVADSKIQKSPGGIGSELVYKGSCCPLEKIDRCLRVFDQIIFKCLPDHMKQIKDIEWD